MKRVSLNTVREVMELINGKRRLRFHFSVRYGVENYDARLVQVPRQSAAALLSGLPADMLVLASLDDKDLVIG